MGSSFSVLNDTDSDVYIRDGAELDVAIDSIRVAAAVLPGALAITAAGFGAQGAHQIGPVCGLGFKTIQDAIECSKKEALKIEKDVSRFLNGSTLLKPGESYKFRGSLSLPRKVHVMNDELKIAYRVCVTGATNESNKSYKISKHFPALATDIGNNSQKSW